jgi:RNA polymerase sigma-70 factor (ECF subfamily)
MQENTGDIKDSKSENADHVIYRKQIKEAIFKALESLPEKERVSIILCKYEELPYEEVAEVLGCTVGAVKTYVYRGRMRLIEKLKPYLKGEENHEL